MAERALIFECRDSRLLGIVHEPASSPDKTGIVIVVGGPQYRVGSHRQFTLMARQFAEAGYAVLRFDYRGMGDSDGAERSFEAVDDDIRAAIDAFMKSVPGVTSVVLWGLCDAASASMIYCNQHDARLRGLIVANPWARTESGQASAYLKFYYLRRLMQKSLWTKVLLGNFSVLDSLKSLLSQIRKVGSGSRGGPQRGSYLDLMLRGVEAFSGRILLLISEHDLTAKEFLMYSDSNEKWRVWKGKRQVERVDLLGCDHTFSNADAIETATKFCLRWLESLKSSA